MILFLTNDVKIKCNEGLLGFSFFREREGTYFHSFPQPLCATWNAAMMAGVQQPLEK